MARGWYIEIWARDGKRAAEHRTLGDFGSALAVIKGFKGRLSDDILRVLAPWNATNRELQELKAVGATLG